ncbi:MAG: SDR family NAD(P)-dependent oxidoreductase [Myxococcota bacterium]
MRERERGWILNISSATSTLPRPPYSDFEALSILYGSTKAALERMTAGLSAALSKHGVFVNSLAPVGAVPTEGRRRSASCPTRPSPWPRAGRRWRRRPSRSARPAIRP